MVKFRLDTTIYLANDNKESSEFTFRRGYSYPSKMSRDGNYLVVGNNDKFEIEIMMNHWDRKKYLEE